MTNALTVNLDAIDDSVIRQAVADYANDVDANGTIRNRPGKFESEPIWTVYFYELSMNGDGETLYRPCPEHTDNEDGCDCELDSYDVFAIQANEVEAFPWLDELTRYDLVLWTDSQGFTMSHICANGHEAWAKLYYGA